jgi:4-aminobutyrate aminotransferase/4-aminobutyrate aminotransferase/(S)-3-amino-2-methylpropionate transaminase
MNAPEIIEGKKKYLVPCLYHFYTDPPLLTRGAMQYLFDKEGKQYTDFFSGVSVMNCGHANPEIINPAIRQIETLQHTTSIYLSELMVRLAERLRYFIGGTLTRSFFVNSGSEANEGALLLAKLHTGKKSFLYLDGALHGRTRLTMNVTGIDMWRTDPDPELSHVKVPRPFCRACPLSRKFPACEYACVSCVDDILAKRNDIAALIAEPLQGNGGIIVYPSEYFIRLKKVLDAHGVLLILDEVQTGFGRTGKKFCFMHYGIEPDILTVAKALGNGFPIGAFITNGKIAASYTRPGASTTGGNHVSVTAALAVLDYIEKNELPQKSDSLGTLVLKRLKEETECFPFVFDVRGRGQMIGVELRVEGKALTHETDRVLEGMKNRGFLIGKTGIDRNVLSFMPPLVIAESDCEAMVEALREELGFLC